MKSIAAFLKRLHGRRRARAVAQAFREQINPDGANGRVMLAHLAAFCCVTRSAHVPGDPHATAFNCGRQEVFHHIVELLGLNPDDFTPQILTELTDEPDAEFP
ncbi:Bbp19 family protein [Azospirillum sp. sgz302134]